MPTSRNSLPEGTDSIISGASAPADDLDDLEAAGLSSELADDEMLDEVDPLEDGVSTFDPAPTVSVGGQPSARAADLRGQAGDKARDFAEQGKERATTALDSVARLIDDAAAQVDEKIGPEYGDYARRAADAVDGLATNLRQKDVDSLFDDARELVRRSPAIAISAAAVIGFALVRLIKSGIPDEPETNGDKRRREPSA